MLAHLLHLRWPAEDNTFHYLLAAWENVSYDMWTEFRLGSAYPNAQSDKANHSLFWGQQRNESIFRRMAKTLISLRGRTDCPVFSLGMNYVGYMRWCKARHFLQDFASALRSSRIYCATAHTDQSSSLSALRHCGYLATQRVLWEDSDQTVRMRRLICVHWAHTRSCKKCSVPVLIYSLWLNICKNAHV